MSRHLCPPQTESNTQYRQVTDSGDGCGRLPFLDVSGTLRKASGLGLEEKGRIGVKLTQLPHFPLPPLPPWCFKELSQQIREILGKPSLLSVGRVWVWEHSQMISSGSEKSCSASCSPFFNLLSSSSWFFLGGGGRVYFSVFSLCLHQPLNGERF